MVVSVVYAHQDIPEADVKFEMHVKAILAWMVAHVNLSMGTLVIFVSVHQDIPAVDAKYEMHVKAILAWMEELVNLSMGMLVIFVSVLVALVVYSVKIVRTIHIFMNIIL